MKKLFGSVAIEHAVTHANTKALIEGELQRKPAQPEIAQLLLVCGRVQIAAVDVGEDSVLLEGKSIFNVIYADIAGEAHSFEASAPFAHTVEAEGARAGMTAKVSCAVHSVDARILSGGSVAVKAHVCIDARVSEQTEREVLCGLQECQGVYFQEKTLHIPRHVCGKNVLFSFREDIRLPQNLPTVHKLLHVDAYGVAKNIHVENMKVIAEGDLRLHILYESNDKNAPLQRYSGTIPFGEIIDVDDAEQTDTASVLCETVEISMSCMEGSEDMITIEGSAKLCCDVYRFSDSACIADLYSVKKNLECVRAPLRMRGLERFFTAKTILRSTAELPKNAPDVSRVLYSHSCAGDVAAKPMHGYVEVSGNIYTQMCYACINGSLFTTDIVTPFTTEISMESVAEDAEVQPCVQVEYFEVEGSGRDLDTKFALEIMLGEYSGTVQTVVIDAEERSEPLKLQKGILIYVTEKKEACWDICKKFHIAPDALSSMNPDCDPDFISAGQKLIIFP